MGRDSMVGEAGRTVAIAEGGYFGMRSRVFDLDRKSSPPRKQQRPFERMRMARETNGELSLH